MSRTAQVLQHLFAPDVDVAVKLNITPRMLSRIQESDRHVRPWLMRYLIDRYSVNPLYIYGVDEDMYIKK